MKKRLFVLVLAVVMVLAATPAFASDQAADGCQMDEIVWKTGPADAWDWYTIVGEMHTRIDPSTSTATITFYAHEGYKFAETHLAVAGSSEGLVDGKLVRIPDFDGIPHSKGGPKPGKFAFGDEWTPPVSEVTYVVDISGIPADDFIVVAHSVVVRESDGMTETAWGTGCFEPYFNYPGSNWARWYWAWYPKW